MGSNAVDMSRMLEHVVAEVEGDSQVGSDQVPMRFGGVTPASSPMMPVSNESFGARMDRRMMELHATTISSISGDTRPQGFDDAAPRIKAISRSIGAGVKEAGDASAGSPTYLTSPLSSTTSSNTSGSRTSKYAPGESIVCYDGIEKMNRAFLNYYVDKTDSSDLRMIVDNYKKAFVKGEAQV